MIPRTFPSSVASNGSRQMIVYFLPSVSGLTRWVDYIPVKFTTVATAATENTYNQNGYIPVVSLSSIAGATPFKEYVPVFLDSSAADADVWDVTITGFIPVGTAGIGGAALYLDFAATTSLDPRITFSRTTNATVTGSNGLIQNAPMNLLTFSEQFDNAAWTKDFAAVTANTAVAPNGTTTADKIVETAVNNQHRVFQAFASATTTTYVFTAYLKAAERTWGVLSFPSISSTEAYFDLVNGVVGTVSSNIIAATITPAGNGWYRCSISHLKTSAGTIYPCVQVSTGNNTVSYLGDGTSGIYTWGAQLELGSTATTYNPTTVKNLLGYTEHFDNAAWTKSNAFVQTNLILQSDGFSSALITPATGVVVVSTGLADPQGGATARQVRNTITTEQHRLYSGVTSSGRSTFSVQVKNVDAGFVQLSMAGVVVSAFGATFNLTAKTYTLVGTALPTAEIIDIGNGYLRLVLIAPANETGINNAQLYILEADSGSVNPTTTGTGKSVIIAGAQLVQGTSAGDYKATYAAAAAVGYTDIYGQPFAQKLVENTATALHFARQDVASTVAPNVLSFYAKAAERSVAWATLDGSSNTRWFDLSSGTTGGVGAGSSSITDVGGGWYRCSYAFTRTSGTAVCFIGVSSSTTIGNYTGDGTSGIYIFGAQLSDSASVDPYVYNPVAAPTSTAYYGPRFDYDPVTLAPKGLLIEEQRTNLLFRSEEFDNASWTKSNATVTANAVVSPDGTVDAETVTDSATSAPHAIYGTAFTVTAGTAYTVSVYLKTGTLRYVSLRGEAAGAVNTYAWATVDLQTGAVNANALCTAISTPVGNGWYRLAVTFTSFATVAGGANVVIAGSNVATSPITTSTLGNSYIGTGSTFYVWGAQVEAGAFATSYIPTVASQVTRAADSASMIGNNFARWYNQTTGTFYAEAGYMLGGTFGSVGDYYLAANDGTGNNVLLMADVSGLVCQSILAGTQTYNQNTGTRPTASAFKKQVFAYAVNDANQASSGTLGTTDTTVSVPIVNQLSIGKRWDTTGYLNGHISRITYYPRRLANSELQSITA
jgi:hypothetical protein